MARAAAAVAMHEQPCPLPRPPAHLRPARATPTAHPPSGPTTSGSSASTDTDMDLPDDPLGMGPPERGDFDWLVPEAGEGAESRAHLPGPPAGHAGAPPVRDLLLGYLVAACRKVLK